MAQARGWVAPAIPEALARARGQAVAQVTVGSEPALREQAPAAWVAGEAELESARALWRPAEWALSVGDSRRTRTRRPSRSQPLSVAHS